MPNFFTRHINGKFQLILQKETKINSCKYFGLRQTFNSDREHTSSYSKNGPATYSADYGHATPSNGFTDENN